MAAENEQLNLIEQAAIVLLSMGEAPAAGVLRCLEREDLLAVTQVMSRMSGIRVDSVRQSLQHFLMITASKAVCMAHRAASCSVRWAWRWASRLPAA